MSWRNSKRPDVPRFKLVLLGDAGVGKTTLSKRMNKQPIVPYEGSTIGCSYLNYRYHDVSTEPPTEFRLDMWDTAGQERYFSLVDIYLKDCDIVLMVYDITRPATLQSLFDRWLPQYLQSRYHSQINWKLPTKERRKMIYFIGNKADNDDMEKDPPLSLLRMNKNILSEYDIRHIRMSALHNRNVDTFIHDLKEEILRDFVPNYATHQRKPNALENDLIVDDPSSSRKKWFSSSVRCCGS